MVFIIIWLLCCTLYKYPFFFLINPFPLMKIALFAGDKASCKKIILSVSGIILCWYIQKQQKSPAKARVFHK